MSSPKPIFEYYNSIEEVLERIKSDLDSEIDAQAQNKPKQMVSKLYSRNATGKTLLSELFYRKHKKDVLFYNAFTEDLFYWDNENRILKFNNNAKFTQRIGELGLDGQIVKNFQRHVGSQIKPEFNFKPDESQDEGHITFTIPSEDNVYPENIKISRGEESIFIWTIFSTVLDRVIDERNKESDKPSTNVFDDIKYVVIDDPVSSMDDSWVVTIALDIVEQISRSKGKLKFLILSHHALFFNVLHYAKEKKWGGENYVLSKSGEKFLVKPQKSGKHFTYHHAIIFDIRKAIKEKSIKKYHFNMLRTLLEKTAVFLGYSGDWKKFLLEIENGQNLIRILNRYSHENQIELEPIDLPDNDISLFEKAFESFLIDFKWAVK